MADVQDQVNPEQPYVPQYDEETMRKCGIRLAGMFDDYEKNRYPLEQKWLRNIRQFRGIYDPETEKRIAPDQSTAYPKITRTKVIGTVARLMEMLFPQTEKNWGIKPSPLPNLARGDLQDVLDSLTAENPNPTDDQIEAAIMSYATAKSERMSKEIQDQLDEIDYITLARKVVFSAVLYSCGVVFGPMMRKVHSRTWSRDPVTGRLRANEGEKLVPYYEHVPIWEWYPDLSAKDFEQMDGSFRRHIMSRNQLRELTKRPDFIAENIKKYLRDHTVGNYRERDWERSLRTDGDRKNQTNLTSSKYELREWWGSISGHELRACGVEIPDDKLDIEVRGNIWMIDNVIIKALLNPHDERVQQYHEFVYEEDDISLLGSGLADVIRDSQLSICEAARMILDNASVVTGPSLEVNQALLMPGQSMDIHAFKIWVRDDEGQSASQPAVRNINADSHIDELSAVINLFMGFADTETALPPPALGDVSGTGKEPYRTASGTSMLLGAAALPIRDTVRNFDKFTTSFVSSIYFWNMQFNSNEKIKGDYTIIARGSTSLIAKEVRAQALNALSMTLTPEERMYVSTKKLLIEKFKAQDLPMELLEDDDVIEMKLQEQARNAAATAEQQARTLDAQIRETVADAFKKYAEGQRALATANADTFNALVEGVTNASEIDRRSETGGSQSPGRSVPSTARAGAAGASATA